MLKFQELFVLLVLLIIIIPQHGNTQELLSNELEYKVNKVYPYIVITIDELGKAQSLNELNKHFKSSWVKEYISVEISANIEGKTIKKTSSDDCLTKEQKTLMNLTVEGDTIFVLVKYIPNNSLTQKEVREMDFSFTVSPQIDAGYFNGQEELIKYLKDNTSNKISHDNFKQYDVVAITFSINTVGEIVDAHVFESGYQSFKDEYIEGVLLESICNMPNWRPAEYSDGTKVKQDFVFTVGSMASCLIPLLKIREH